MQANGHSWNFWLRHRLGVALLCMFSVLWCNSTAAADVEKWKQFRTEYNNPTWTGNPLDVDFTGVFTHTKSGRTLKQFGFYAGGTTWKLYFMPDAVGEWKLVTTSSDPELNGKTNSFTATPSTLLGKLLPIENRWKFTDGNYAVPVVLWSEAYFRSTDLNNGISNLIDWMHSTVHASYLRFMLYRTNPPGSAPQDARPFIDGDAPNTVYQPFWERMNQHLDYMRDRNMGFALMFFSDSSFSPNKNGIPATSDGSISALEKRLFKYAIARFGAYPVIAWDSGIDIGEYRSDTWVKNFVSWFQNNDPWKHPVGNRHGGGSGSSQPNNATFFSDGSSSLPPQNTYISAWKTRTTPTIFTDKWAEDASRGSFDRKKIRKAAWTIPMVGGTGIGVSGNETSGYLNSNYIQDFKAAPDVGYAVSFWNNNVFRLGLLKPNNNLVSPNGGNGNYSAAAPGLEYVVFLENGGSIQIDLTDATGPLKATWYDPFNGNATNINGLSGGSATNLTAPGQNSGGTNEWVLHVWSSVVEDTIASSPPLNLLAQ